MLKLYSAILAVLALLLTFAYVGGVAHAAVG
jgi:hypothetical protein